MSHADHQSEVRQEAALWVARRHSGAWSAEHEAAFRAWLDQSPLNHAAYTAANRLWGDLHGLGDAAPEALAVARAYAGWRRRARRTVSLAAAAVMLLAIGGWWIWARTVVDTATYRTAIGEHLSLDLADGSRLELNTGSEATVRFSRSQREVHLTRGEAVFTVAHEARPFDVVAGRGRVRDIGTQFAVRHYTDRIAVAVLDGVVEVRSGESRAIPVRRGQVVSYAPAGPPSPIATIDVGTHAAWRQGAVVFKGRPLRDVLDELARYQEVTITATMPALLDTPVSGSFPTDDVAAALKTIGAALSLDAVQVSERVWRLQPAGAP